MDGVDNQLGEKCLTEANLVVEADHPVENHDRLNDDDEVSNKSTLSINNAESTNGEGLITTQNDDEITSIELTRCEKFMQYPVWIWKGTCKAWHGCWGLIMPKAIDGTLLDGINNLRKETEEISTVNLNPDVNSENSTSPMTESLGSDIESLTDSDESIDVVDSLKQEIEEMLKIAQLNSDLKFLERKRRHEEEIRENWSKFREVIEAKVNVEKEEFNRWACSPD